MNKVTVDEYFADWLKDSIPREDNPNDCEITEIKISYREVYYKYITKDNEEKENSLTIEILNKIRFRLSNYYDEV